MSEPIVFKRTADPHGNGDIILDYGGPYSEGGWQATIKWWAETENMVRFATILIFKRNSLHLERTIEDWSLEEVEDWTRKVLVAIWDLG